VSARGAVVSKDDIVRRVWPATVVDECNLRFQIAVLRKALGADRDLIKTISGRGYLFVADQEVVRLARSEAEDRHWPSTSSAMAQREAAETCETLRSLLRSVLDELWEMTAQAEQVSPASFSAAATHAASRLRR
jgi:DNA-binding winged helix-turn-helix (wHTH) protein